MKKEHDGGVFFRMARMYSVWNLLACLAYVCVGAIRPGWMRHWAWEAARANATLVSFATILVVSHAGAGFVPLFYSSLFPVPAVAAFFLDAAGHHLPVVIMGFPRMRSWAWAYPLATMAMAIWYGLVAERFEEIYGPGVVCDSGCRISVSEVDRAALLLVAACAAMASLSLAARARLKMATAG